MRIGIVRRDIVCRGCLQSDVIITALTERRGNGGIRIPAANRTIGADRSIQCHGTGATTLCVGQRGHTRLRVHHHRQGDDAVAALLVLNRDGLHTCTRNLRAGVSIRKFVAAERQLLLAGGGVTNRHVRGHNTVATRHHRRQCLGIVTARGVVLVVPSPAVTLIDSDLLRQHRIDGEMQGHHAVAVVHGMQRSGVVAGSGEGFIVPHILDTGHSRVVDIIGRINRGDDIGGSADTVCRVIGIDGIECRGLGHLDLQRAAGADSCGEIGILIPGGGHASDRGSGKGGIARTAQGRTRQNGSGGQGLHRHLHHRGSTATIRIGIVVDSTILRGRLDSRRCIGVAFGKIGVVGVVPTDDTVGRGRSRQGITTLQADNLRIGHRRGGRNLVDGHHHLLQCTAASVLGGSHHIEGGSLGNFLSRAAQNLGTIGVAVPSQRAAGSGRGGQVHRVRTAIGRRSHRRSGRHLIDRGHHRSLGTLTTRFRVVSSHLEILGSGYRRGIVAVRGGEEDVIVVVPLVLDIRGRSGDEGHTTLSATADAADVRGGRQRVDHHHHRDSLAFAAVGADGGDIVGRGCSYTDTVCILGTCRHIGIIPLGIAATVAGSSRKVQLDIVSNKTLRGRSRSGGQARNFLHIHRHCGRARTAVGGSACHRVGRRVGRNHLDGGARLVVAPAISISAGGRQCCGVTRADGGRSSRGRHRGNGFHRGRHIHLVAHAARGGIVGGHLEGSITVHRRRVAARRRCIKADVIVVVPYIFRSAGSGGGTQRHLATATAGGRRHRRIGRRRGRRHRNAHRGTRTARGGVIARHAVGRRTRHARQREVVARALLLGTLGVVPLQGRARDGRSAQRHLAAAGIHARGVHRRNARQRVHRHLHRGRVRTAGGGLARHRVGGALFRRHLHRGARHVAAPAVAVGARGAQRHRVARADGRRGGCGRHCRFGRHQHRHPLALAVCRGVESGHIVGGVHRIGRIVAVGCCRVARGSQTPV